MSSNITDRKNILMTEDGMNPANDITGIREANEINSDADISLDAL